MIKLSIKNQEEPEVEKGFEGVVSLEQKEDGVALTMESDNGFTWYIVRLKTDGTFIRNQFLSDDIGLQVDDDGKILESEEQL